MKIAVHITHEAVQKIGGIGSVISGFCTADKYKVFFDKTVLYGPLFSFNGNVFSRLGKGGEVLFSNYENYDTRDYNSLFLNIIKKYNVDIVYGSRTLVNEFNINKKNTVDVILLSINRMKVDEVNIFKYKLWKKYNLESERYNEWDYEQYLRIGIPYLEILLSLYPKGSTFYHFAHEYMGIPSAFSVLLSEFPEGKHKTIFYAHEISPSRTVVENHPGHDVSFYNTMTLNKQKGKTFEDEYGNQRGNYRAELVKRSRYLDYIFVVSDLIKEEYRYLIPDADDKKIRVVYNGIPIKFITAEEKQKSRAFLQEYINNLFNFTPDILFTHVTRLVLSKGIWRDITFLYILDELFKKRGMKGAYILLSSLIGTGREPLDIALMEKEYGWPLIHKRGWPDLVGAETDIYNYLSLFNARSNNIKGIFLNQFGFNRRRCGMRVPEGASIIDLRVGSDAEFGFSIYEPFGISQLEVVPFGGIAALSTSCGCYYLIEKVFQKNSHKPCYPLNFIGGVEKILKNINLKSINMSQRFELEKEIFKKEGQGFINAIPKTDPERIDYLYRVQENMEKLGWESIVDSMNLSTL